MARLKENELIIKVVGTNAIEPWEIMPKISVLTNLSW